MKSTVPLIWKLLKELFFPNEVNEHMNIYRYERIAKEVNQFITENSEHPLTVANIAKQFSYSTEQFNRIIKVTNGISPALYIRSIKVEQAKEWLENSEKSVTEIANVLGYPYEQNFCRMFRNWVGMSPMLYRNSQQEKLKME
jgi:two-component system response regulator YesN